MMIGPAYGGVISLVALGVWCICMIFAGYNYWSAYAEVQPRLPPQFQGSRIARLALDTLIWDPAIAPTRARRKYLIAHVLGSISAIALAAVVWAQSQFVGAVVFITISVCGAAVTFNRWRKYKDLLRTADE